MVQGVRDVFEVTDLEGGTATFTARATKHPSDLAGKLVFIGKGLASAPLGEDLLAYLENDQ